MATLFARLVRMPIETIVIVGGGLVGWLTAAALARRTPCQIVVVETPSIDDSLGLPLKVEATLPSMTAFHAAIGFDEDSFMAGCGGSFTLGRALSNWTKEQTPSFGPYGEIGASLGPIAFHQLVARMRAQGNTVNLANYSVAALCAQSGRFARPPSDYRSVLATMAYGLHLESSSYRDVLKADAIARGVKQADGEVASLEQADSRLIDSVTLASGQSVSGDLFVDCTGQSRAVIGRMRAAKFEDWSCWLPCNQCAVSVSPTYASPPPYTHVDAHNRGWQSFASTQNVLGEALVYQSDEPERDGYHFSSGRMASLWAGNCIAIGGAAAIIDPIASTQLHLASSAILRLLRLFPHNRACRIEAAEYNRQTIEELENVRDFAILHYKANGRIGDPFWDSKRTIDVPARLAHKMDLYRSTGRLALHDEESFEASEWIALFDALGVRPNHYDAMADAIDRDDIANYLQQVRNAMLKAVATVPTHGEYLKQHIKARA
jgi:tryptophan 7-halogenase